VTPTPPPPAGNSGAGPSHIFLIVMENQEYDQLIGNPQAPYLNQLAHQYTVADDYHAITHPSLPNYLALLGGNTFGIRSNCTDCSIDQPNLVDELEAKGKRWKSYQEDLPRLVFSALKLTTTCSGMTLFCTFKTFVPTRAAATRWFPLPSSASISSVGSCPTLSGSRRTSSMTCIRAQ
jgi:hypothetical protein